MTDDYGLQRFVDAQDGAYAGALAALRARTLDPGWLGLVFPRFGGVRAGEARKTCAIGSLDEARAYLAHPILGPRLRESLTALEKLHDLDIAELLSERDRADLQSSLTLFAEASDEILMQRMLSIWFGCRAEEATIAELDLRP